MTSFRIPADHCPTLTPRPLAETREISEWIDQARRDYELGLRDGDLQDANWAYENMLDETLFWDEVIDE